MKKLYKKAMAMNREPSLKENEDVTSPGQEVSTSNDKSKKIDDLAWEITRAVTNCPHDINAEKIILKFEGNSEGHNALNQLIRRVKAALAANPTFFG
ncbi:hypothetical protein [Rhizobium sp. MHM7A]|uniref:hypothetical protein n=1 Tax=Rhizobium sp. MHM7A TaxID=2583233 RepID=UPI001106988B|nr:hypothetical protein [Rhizobium sp. MHM7A]TLX17095.1 hypothetical protein FFR93_07210 [Rhizobium sp. MHM7A]